MDPYKLAKAIPFHISGASVPWHAHASPGCASESLLISYLMFSRVYVVCINVCYNTFAEEGGWILVCYIIVFNWILVVRSGAFPEVMTVFTNTHGADHWILICSRPLAVDTRFCLRTTRSATNLTIWGSSTSKRVPGYGLECRASLGPSYFAPLLSRKRDKP